MTDLPEEVIQRIEELHERLGTTDHYALLGVGRAATRAEVRSAFLRAAPRFHPDRFYGKNLGPYSEKMQRIFGQMSTAHDTLLDDAKRAAYDRQLPPPPSSPSPAGAPREPSPSSGAIDAGSRPSPSPSTPYPSSGVHGTAPTTSAPRIAVEAPRARFASDPGTGAARPATPSRAPMPSSPEMERAKAQAFAARLGGSARMRAATPVVPFAPAGVKPAASPAPPTPSGQPATPRAAIAPTLDPRAAAEALRRRYEEKMSHARSRQASDHVEAARAAEARGDFAEAARLYAVALTSSSDATLKAAKDNADARARAQLHAQALERARDAESKGDYAASGAAWARAFDLAPDAETAHRAAMAFRRSGEDPRRGARYGEEAVKMDPSKAAYRVTLALLYADAGLHLRAKGELERAHALDPNSALVKEAVARIKAKG